MPPPRTHTARRAARLAALAAVATALAGCQSVAGTSQFTQVRYIDASPDAPALDVYQNSTLSLYDMGFGSKSSYIAITPGNYTYSVVVTNTQQQLANVHGSFGPGSQFTILVGNVSANLQMTVLKDQSVAAPPGQSALRFVDQTTRFGAVDIYLVPSSGQLSGTAPILTGITSGSTPIYLNIPIGTYSIVILPTGTANSTTTTTTSTSSGTTSTTTTTTTTIPTLYSGNQVTYPAASARTILLLDQPLVAPAGVQVVTADDYDSPSANN